MKAIYYEASGFHLRELPRPRRTAGESLIRISAAGICATDLEIAKGYMSFTGVPGHEFTGTVEECETPELVGKRVVGEISCPCGKCDLCRRGHGRHCPDRTVLGIAGRDGCFAEYITLPDANLHVLPDSMTDFQGVMVEPTAAAFRIAEQLEAVTDAGIAVVGDGRLGLLAAQALASEGASVCVFGKHPERETLLAPHDIEYRTADATELSSAERSFPVVVECTGSRAGPAAALGLVAPMGTLILKTTVRDPLLLPSDRLVVDEISVVGSRCGPFRRAIEALRDREVHVEGMLDRSFPLSQGIEALRYAGRPGVLKTVITI